MQRDLVVHSYLYRHCRLVRLPQQTVSFFVCAPLQPGVPLSECKGHTGPVQQVSFLPSAASAAAGLGRVPLLLTGSEDWTARLWDVETGMCRGACVGHGGAITAMQTIHSNASTRFVTGANDGSIGVWGLDCELVSLVQQYKEPVLLLKQGGDTLVSGGSSYSTHPYRAGCQTHHERNCAICIPFAYAPGMLHEPQVCDYTCLMESERG